MKEAAAIRGIPDIIGCYNGRMFAFEVKRAKSEVYYKDGREKISGRTVLQKYNLDKIKKAGGYACFLYPENYQEIFRELFAHHINSMED